MVHAAVPLRGVYQRRGVSQRRYVRAATTNLLTPSATPAYDRFDEQRLVESARRDANAFAELYRRYVDRIYAYAYRRSSSRPVAEDVTSATFEKALRGLDTFRWKEPGIGPWLFRIASNELVNAYRGDNRQAKLAMTMAGQRQPSTPWPVTAGADETLATALNRIRPRYQRALTLRYLADLTNEEAAAAMGVSRATMAVIVHRGVAALRRSYEAVAREGVLSND